VFNQEMRRGGDRSRRGRPGEPAGCGGSHGRHYRGGDEDAGPEFHHGGGPGHGGMGRGGRGRGPGRAFGGPMGWMARDRFFAPGRGPMVRRGDVRTAILALLAEEPMHGYQIIGQLGERSGGMWRPSAGSVYPTLQQLEDEGLVKGEETEGRTVYSLTESGKTAAEQVAKGPRPWDMPGATEATNLFGLFHPLGIAVAQVSQVGSPEAIEQARTILIEARRSLYRLLAEDGASTPPTAE
jgi:DNA-binding PadR family transcriptional regulator